MSTEYFNNQWRIPNNKNQSLVSNYSMEFDGTSDVINCGLNAPFNAASTNFSISLWCKSPNSFTDSGNLVESRLSYANPVGIAIEFISNTMYFRKSGSTFGKTITEWGLNNTNWNHIVYTYDLTLAGNVDKIFVYINGVFLSSATQAATSQPASTGDFTIGDGLRGNFNGSIDQVSVFDYTLSASQVATLYGGGTAITNPMSLSPKPVAYYQLGDQSVDNGANYLVPNNSLQDYVFETSPAGPKYFTMPSITISTTATISIWFNIKTLGSVQQTPFATTSSDKLSFRLSTNLQIIYADSSGFVSLITDIPPTNFLNKWHHLALVQDANGGTVYIDNVNKGVIGLKTPTFGAIGSPTDVNQSINGFVSNAAIFSTNLPATGTESIASLYNNGSPALDISSYSGLERWYKLNAQDTFDGSNWTIKDYAGSNDGTSSGMTSANLVQSNLQHTSGYSPYALDFDGNNDVINCGNDSSLQITGAMTVSYWFKGQGGSGTVGGVGKLGNNGSRGFCLGMDSSGTITFFIAPTASSIISASYSHTTDTNWHHIVGVFNPSTSLELYFDGQSVDTTPTSTSSQYNASNNLQIGARGDSTGFFNGGISNVATWNTNLSSSEISEIYNQGVPSNLNTFSGTAPIAWWQLGSNSSFNTNWTCLDEMGTNNGISVNMTNDDIVNGVGYSGNGLGTSTIDIKGDAPYSSANGLSENMDVLDRTTDVPS